MALPQLGTYNGDGTALLGIKREPDGTFTATAWQVWKNMPVRPISRHRIRFQGAQQNNLGVLMRRFRSFETMQDTPLDPGEVRATRLWHYLIAPLILLLPLLSCIPLWGWVGGIAVGMGNKASQGQAVAVVIGVCWLSIGGQIWVHLRDARVEKT